MDRTSRRFSAGCHGKAQHANRSNALIACRKLYDKTSERTIPYYCRWCGRWHTAHPPERMRPSTRSRQRKYR